MVSLVRFSHTSHFLTGPTWMLSCARSPGVVKSTEEAVQNQLFASANIFVATDGESKGEACAVGLVDANSDLSFPSGDGSEGSEEQSPFKQELSATLYTAKDMTEGHVCFIADCQAAILAVLNLMLTCFPMLAGSHQGSQLRQRSVHVLW
ncbi:unnamed protein product [Symbiodinium sp. CCMP2592]|nr:unnamed protein product [Symbiodinium sp. CCMP2592]